MGRGGRKPSPSDKASDGLPVTQHPRKHCTLCLVRPSGNLRQRKTYKPAAVSAWGSSAAAAAEVRHGPCHVRGSLVSHWSRSPDPSISALLLVARYGSSATLNRVVISA